MAQWSRRYEELKEYKAEHGDFRVPLGSGLGNWVSEQRSLATQGSLMADRVRRLEAIEFDWNSNHIDQELWNRRCEELEQYKAKHGDCNIPLGSGLGNWVSKQRNLATKGSLLEDRARRLEAIKIDFNAKLWNRRYEELKKYKAEYGDCNVPWGNTLGNWVTKQRSLARKGSLLADRARRLEAIKFAWNPNENRQLIHFDQDLWNKRYEELKEYKAERGDCNVPPGNAFGTWVENQREMYKKGSLRKDRARRLEAIKFAWNDSNKPRDRYPDLWNKRYEELKEYRAVHGDSIILRQHLAKWASNQRALYKRGSLLEDRAKRLEAIGFAWKGEASNENDDRSDTEDNLDNDGWKRNFNKLVEFKGGSGHVNVPQKHPGLGPWVSYQRVRYKSGMMPLEQISSLENIGFEWVGRKGRKPKGDSATLSEGESISSNSLQGNLRTEHSEDGSESGGLDKIEPRGYPATLSEGESATSDALQAFRTTGGLNKTGSKKKAEWKFQPLRRKRNIRQLNSSNSECPGNNSDDRRRSCDTSFEIPREIYSNGRPLRRVLKNAVSCSEISTDDSILSHSASPDVEDNDNDTQVGKSSCGNDDEGGSNGLEDQRQDQNVKIMGPTFLQAVERESLQVGHKIDCCSQSAMQGGMLRSAQAKAWYKRYEELKEYIAEHGDCNVPQRYAKRKGLGTWVNTQRNSYKNGSLLDYRIKRLEQIGFTWRKVSWSERFEQLVKFRRKHGHCNVPCDTMLGRWVAVHRPLCQPHLEKLGFEWDARKSIHKTKASAGVQGIFEDTNLSENESVYRGSNDANDRELFGHEIEVSISVANPPKKKCTSAFLGNAAISVEHPEENGRLEESACTITNFSASATGARGTPNDPSNEERDGAHISDYTEVSHSSFECDGVNDRNENKRNGDAQIDNKKDGVASAAPCYEKDEMLSVRTAELGNNKVDAEEKVLQLEIKNFLLEEQLVALHEEETDLIAAKLNEGHRREMEQQQPEMNESHRREMEQQPSEMIESHRNDSMEQQHLEMNERHRKEMERLQSAHSHQLKALVKELEKARENQISDIDADCKGSYQVNLTECAVCII